MSVIGNPLVTTNYISDSFSGDASTVAFTLSQAPASAASIAVYISGLYQIPTSAYTISGTTLTFTGAPPTGTNNITVLHLGVKSATLVPVNGSVTPQMLSNANVVYWSASNNNVGIGNVTPTSLLTVTGTAALGNTTITGALTVSTNTATIGTSLYSVANGNIGVGTSTPAYRLQIKGDAIGVTSADGTVTNFIDYTTIGTINAADLAIIANNSTKMTVAANGSVGVGTAAPTVKLHVSSSVSGYTSSLADSVTNAAVLMKTNNSDSTVTSFGGLSSGAATIQRSNGSGTTAYDIVINPFGGSLLVGQTSTFSQGSPIFVAGSSTSNQPIGHRGYGGVDGTYVDWLISAPYQGNTTEQNRIKSSISSGASSSGLQFWISDGAGASTQTRSFQINRTSCTVVGSLSKGSGSFKIDHPLPSKAQTHHLVHSFIEGPQADLIYRGKVTLVNGTAEVNIDTVSGMTPGTFVLLCRDVQCFTTNETDWTPVRGSVSGNMLTIEAQDLTSTATISWMVIGERQDKHMHDTEWTDNNGKVIVEPLKTTP